MKLLHTADIHIGKHLYGKKRYREHELFFQWLVKIIIDHQVDLLIIAGDIFDSAIPTNRAQEVYYEFLSALRETCCKHVVVTAGNHDSGAFLTAPKLLLKNLNIHLIGNISTDIHDEIIPIYGDAGLEAVVCAIPYLREQDIRTMSVAEDITDQSEKICQGITAHYRAVCDAALEFQRNARSNVPIIATGHLFTAGENKGVGEGVRDLYVGNIAYIPVSIFPDYLDYVALGHLHIAQKVGNNDIIRYSGSPLTLGFGELGREKSVVLVDFPSTSDGFHKDDKENKENKGNEVNGYHEDNIARISTITTIPVPSFQRLARIVGDIHEIEQKLTELSQGSDSIWVEIEYTGKQLIADLVERLQAQVENSSIEILRIKNNRLRDDFISNASEQRALSEMTPQEVFERFLDMDGTTDADERAELMLAYQEILVEIQTTSG